MDGAVVGDEVIVGRWRARAGRQGPAAAHALGRQPRARVRPLTPEEVAHLAESAAHYVNLKNDYLGKERGRPR